MGTCPEINLVPRNASIAELVDLCARDKIPFSGPDSLCYRVSMMGYNTTSLYEMVMGRKSEIGQ